MTNREIFEKALSKLSDICMEIQIKLSLSDLEMRDLLELVRSNYE